jgi:hypothetical protein
MHEPVTPRESIKPWEAAVHQIIELQTELLVDQSTIRDPYLRLLAVVIGEQVVSGSPWLAIDKTVDSACSRASGGSFGNPDEPRQGAVNAKDNPSGIVDPGPQNQTLTGQFPKAFTPPPTDVRELAQHTHAAEQHRGQCR